MGFDEVQTLCGEAVNAERVSNRCWIPGVKHPRFGRGKCRENPFIEERERLKLSVLLDPSWSKGWFIQ